MPSLFRVGRYLVFFWSNENGEPVHVHVCEGRPTQNSTKLWLTAAGGCVVANNDSRIPARELADLIDIISAQFFMVCSAWKAHFSVDDINFYC